MPWAIKWRSENKLDGKTERLMGHCQIIDPLKGGYTIMCFRTREEARRYVKQHYSYIKWRADLRAEPHGWKMPQVVKVTVTVQEDQSCHS